VTGLLGLLFLWALGGALLCCFEVIGDWVQYVVRSFRREDVPPADPGAKDPDAT
jgi:hypothetical protein